MRLIFTDVSTEFAQLLQQASDNKAAVECIQVTRAELQALLSHKNAGLMFGDYYAKRQQKLQDNGNEIFKARQMLERVTTQQDRQDIFNRISELEVQNHKLSTEVPDTIVQNGITIRVSMKA